MSGMARADGGLFPLEDTTPPYIGGFGAALDELARRVGGWGETQMVYAVEVIGQGDDPQVMLTGSSATWSHRESRWVFKGHKDIVKAAVRLSEYRATFPKKADAA